MELAVVVTLIVLYLTLGSSRTAAFGGLVQKNKYGQSKQRIGIVAGRRKLAGPLVYREDFKINGFDHLPTLDGNRRFQREKRASELEGSDSWTLRNKLLVGGGGFLVILVCTAICLWCFCRRKNRKPRKLNGKFTPMCYFL
ncbi:uncharacterized protein [Apostichopus japonicus]|uniref:uncharacterized protein n=1 Tax=Stichopus japonicus TaxID=307972 RepID=UPI003AB89B88